ncbi:MAG: hypothetical protein OCD76_22395 [Reichenbachiella sp.]
MNRISYTLFLLLLPFLAGAQSFLIVDHNFNAPTGDHIYSTLQAAHDAASAGDTIFIQPGPAPYGTITISKEIHLVGIGFALDKDMPYYSRLDIVVWTNNIDGTSNASNSTISGLYLNSVIMRHGSGGEFTLSDVTIDNCLILGTSNYGIVSDVWTSGGEVPITNLIISNCDIRGSLYFQNVMTNTIIHGNLIRTNIEFHNTSTSNTATISNNIIYGAIRKEYLSGTMNILHNNFIGVKGTNNAFSTQLVNAAVSYNIFYGRTPSVAAAGSTSVDFKDNVFTGNISYETGDDQLPPTGGGTNTGLGNNPGVSPLFNNVPILNTWETARDFSLQAESPAIENGSSGSDIGITGGVYPFQSSNYTLITAPRPTIQSFNTDAVINPGDNLNISITIKAN